MTGGASRRMGAPKAELLVGGLVLAEKLAGQLASTCVRVTVLGREPVEGFAFLRDAEEYGGPLVALARFAPSAPFVFVASCDMPRFDPALVSALRGRIGEEAAIVPTLDGIAQSLCGLYRASCLAVARDLASGGERSMRALLAAVGGVTLTPESFGIDPRSIASANTPEELAALLTDP